MNSNQRLKKLINALTENSFIWIAIICFFVAFSLTQLHKFEVDASADSLLLENDPDLAFFREVIERYGAEDFLLVTFTPNGDVFSEENLKALKNIRDELAEVDNVSKTMSILDVPLLFSPPFPITELTKGFKTIEQQNVDLELAAKELTESPLYKELLLSNDKKTTAIQVLFKRDEKYFSLLKTRNDLLAAKDKNDNPQELEVAVKAFDAYKKKVTEKEKYSLQQVRNIVSKHQHEGKFAIGGASMITSDIVDFINDDLKVFGVSIILFIIISLALAFRHIIWVVFPLISCVINLIVVTGIFTAIGWKVSIISSNYVSLILILTMSICIHLIVRYRELTKEQLLNDKEKLHETLFSMAKPCFFTTFTTMVAFLSLTLSDIVPVIVFGWIMTIGVASALIISFIVFSLLIQFFPSSNKEASNVLIQKLMHAIALFTCKRKLFIAASFTFFGLASIYGMTQLSVENRFIDYFKEHTEIYKGMLEIDTKLGGTTSFDIILNAPSSFTKAQNDTDNDEFDEFTIMDEGEDPIADSYWYNPSALKHLEAINDYIDELPETGKVLSLATINKVARQLNDDKDFNQIELLFLYQALPEDLKQELIGAYLSEDGNQVRISTRVIDSNKDINRNQFIKELRINLLNQFELEPQQLQFTGLLVLYNNLLQSLFTSQIKTLGFVFIAIYGIFLIIFRSFSASIVAMIPNLISAVMILGFIGLIKLPLDFMTITVASITIGIAVDDTIHYMHRFKKELAIQKDYAKAIVSTHTSTGKAMYYTTVIIVAGFSILVLSNFNPGMYFGLLTGFAMSIALAADLFLLPVALMLFKPYRFE